MFDPTRYGTTGAKVSRTNNNDTRYNQLRFQVSAPTPARTVTAAQATSNAKNNDLRKQINSIKTPAKVTTKPSGSRVTSAPAVKPAVKPAPKLQTISRDTFTPRTGSATATGTPAQADPNILSFDDYRQKLIDAVKGGLMAEYEANASVIKNNLTRALSDLEAEKAALNPLYQEQLKGIAQREYATSFQQRELMNQAGWNATNSGLAVGEQTRIKNQASEEKANAEGQYNQYMADILRRQTLNKSTADEELKSLEKYKANKLAGAEADATIQADNRNRAMYESDRSFGLQKDQFVEQQLSNDRSYQMQQAQFQESMRQWNETNALEKKKFSESIRQFNASMAQRTSAQKAADAKDATSFSSAEIDDITSWAIASIMKEPESQRAAAMEEFLANPNYPAKAKENAIQILQSGKNYTAPPSTTGAGSSGLSLVTNVATTKENQQRK